MHAHEIVDLYDNSPNMTLRDLSRRTGWPISRLKNLLMHADRPNDSDPVAAYVAEGLGEW